MENTTNMKYLLSYMKFSRYVSHKEKYRPSSAAMDFVGVNRRQNESGVLRGG